MPELNLGKAVICLEDRASCQMKAKSTCLRIEIEKGRIVAVKMQVVGRIFELRSRLASLVPEESPIKKSCL